VEAKIKLTKTMLDKHIIDANNSVREFVKNVGVVFDDMASGDSHHFVAEFKKQKPTANDLVTVVRCYRTKNARGDRRISIKDIKKHAQVGDVVVFKLANDNVIIEIEN
tara:strand:- start:3515 stop:3838 length:324 start_codon:yes stop_codon:yes gene_type:complete